MSQFYLFLLLIADIQFGDEDFRGYHMNLFPLVIVQISVLIIFDKMLAFGFMGGGQDEKKCIYLRAEKLLKIRCFDMNLKEVPRNLKSSVEVLDLAFNRIKKLKQSSFQPYGSLKYLLLYENMIQFVEPGTFEGLTSLQEIDLSNNALMTIPLEIFQLPSLRNIYVDSNELVNLEKDLEGLKKPIKAPLEYLNVADCGLENIPNIGILPKLWQINASSNPLSHLTVGRLANMCHLKSIDLTKTHMTACTCQQINNHLRYIKADTKFVPVCLETLDLDICPLPYDLTIQSPDFQRCSTALAVAEARNMWLFIAGCCGGVLLVFLLCCCCVYYRRRKKRAKKLKERTKRKNSVISPKNVLNSAVSDDLLSVESA